MTIIETTTYTHGVTAYEVTEDEGLRFVADCGMFFDWPFAGVANVPAARVDCDDCIAARLDAIHADMENR